MIKTKLFTLANGTLSFLLAGLLIANAIGTASPLWRYIECILAAIIVGLGAANLAGDKSRWNDEALEKRLKQEQKLG